MKLDQWFKEEVEIAEILQTDAEQHVSRKALV